MSKTNKQVVSGMYHCPVCVKCGCEMYPKLNGVGVLDIVEGQPYELYNSDLWACKKCCFEIAGGFGQGSIGNYDPNFNSQIEHFKKYTRLIENKC